MEIINIKCGTNNDKQSRFSSFNDNFIHAKHGTCLGLCCSLYLIFALHTS